MDEQMENPGLFEDQQTVIFRLAEESYGIEICRVNEIIRLKPVTPVPKTASHIRGLVNLRGKTVPVVDLRLRLRLTAAPDQESSRIIVVDSELGSIGIVVDAVTEVMTLSHDQIECSPALISDVDFEFVHAVARHRDTIITLLDIDRALAS